MTDGHVLMAVDKGWRIVHPLEVMNVTLIFMPIHPAIEPNKSLDRYSITHASLLVVLKNFQGHLRAIQISTKCYDNQIHTVVNILKSELK